MKLQRSAFSVAAALVLCASFAFAAEPASEPLVTKGAESVGEPVTPYVFDGDLRDLPPPRGWRPGDPIKEIPRRAYPLPGALPPSPPDWNGPDPLAQRQNGRAPGPRQQVFGTPAANFAGMGFTFIHPPDTVGDIGAGHYIQSINGDTTIGAQFRIHAKNGTALTGIIAMQTLAAPGTDCASGLGDPIVLYDRAADRWFMQEFANPDKMCVYISQTPNPVTGGWYAYEFAAPNFPDYPHFGVWPDAYYATSNEGGAGAPIYALDRVNMLLGLAARPYQRFTVPKLAAYTFQVLTPATVIGATPPPAGSPGIIMRHYDDEAHGAPVAGTDGLEMYNLAVDWNTPANSVLATLPRITITDFNSWLVNYTTFSAVSQVPPSTVELDPIREVIMQGLVYRHFGTHQSLVGNFVTNVNPATSGAVVDAGVRWFELRRTGTGNWSLYQEGTFAPGDASTNHWMGGISIDLAGNIGLGYSYTKTTAPTANAGMRYTGRLVTDPLGVMSQGETVINTGLSAQGNERWGDYAAMGVDPIDDCTFYNTNEYRNATNWSTQVTAFRFDVPAAPTMTLTTPVQNRIDVSWTDSSTAGVTRYEVRRSATAGGAFTVVANVTDTSPGVGGGAGYVYQDTPVSGGSTYYYRIYTTGTGLCASLTAEGNATATGPCLLAPAFAGLAAVTNPAGATCQLNLTWPAATAGCGGGVTYNVYRGTTPGFTVNLGSRIASGLAGTAYSDMAGLTSGVTYYYVVRAVDTVSGSEDTNGVERSGVPTGPYSPGTWSDNAGDTGVAKLVLTAPWSVALTGGSVGPRVYQTGAYGNNLCVGARTPTILLGTNAVLTFNSKRDIESGWDKGQVEISTNGGGSWQRVPVNYPDNSNRAGDACGYPSGTTYFSKSSNTPTYAAYTASLTAWNNQFVQIRFNLSSDTAANGAGWWIDDINITNIQIPGTCTTASGAVPEPVPDGRWVVGTQAMLGTRSGATVDVTWDEACGSQNYSMYRGAIGNFAAITGSSCGIGTTGAATGLAMPDNSWWVIAGTAGSAVGSFGRDSTGAQRALTGWGTVCPAQSTQNSTATCP